MSRSTRIRRRFVLIVAVASLAAALGLRASHQSSSNRRPDLAIQTDLHRVRVVPIAGGLAHPWSLAFLPDGDILVAERVGRLRLIRQSLTTTIDVTGVPAVHARLHGGLLDVALHPSFAENRLVYFTYAAAGERGATVTLGRGRLEDGALVDVEDVFVADAWSTTDLHFGSRIAFANDGTLYMSIGERNERERAQDLGDHAGTIVRIRDDGSVPDDNPFVGREGLRAEIFSYGHRNVQGLAVHPETGELWASEHGPQGGDEVNLVRAGHNYGWPLATLGRAYTGELIAPPCHDGTEQPEVVWVPSIGISGITFYNGQRFAGWMGDLFVSGLSGKQIQRVLLTEAGVYGREVLLHELARRIRDLRQGPDELLYVVTDGDEDGEVLRIEPDDPPTTDTAVSAEGTSFWKRWFSRPRSL